jgi:hypothetical protein
MREPFQRVVPEKVQVILELWAGALSRCITSFLRPRLHLVGKNFSTMGAKFLSTNLDALNEALGGSSVTI